jgi:hypothetical protein
MAFTEAQLVTELDSASTGRVINLVRYIPGTTLTQVYAVGGVTPYAGRARWVTLTTSDTAANAAIALRAGLRA